MTAPVTIDLNRGSDLELVLAWEDADGAPLNLSTWTAEIILASESLTGIAAAITGAADGEVTVTMDWDDALAALPSLPSFAVRIIPASGARQASPRIQLRYL